MSIEKLITAGFSASEYQIMLYCIMKRNSDGEFYFGGKEAEELSRLTGKKKRTLQLSFYKLRDIYFTKLYPWTYTFKQDDSIS